MLRLLAPRTLPRGAQFTLDDLAPTQIDALPYAMDADCIARVGDDEIVHIEFQGYNDGGFSERCVWYHVGTALPYRGKRNVRTVAVWLTQLPEGQSRKVMRHVDISVHVKTIVLPNVRAAKLLAHPKTACFAAGANPGGWSDEELCRRVAASLRASDASWPERHVAVVAALVQNRYDAMVNAMEQLQMEPIIIEDLVKFGEDRGYVRGVDHGAAQERVRMLGIRLGRPLTPTELDTLSGRIATMTTERFYDVALNGTPSALTAWLADPNAK